MPLASRKAGSLTLRDTPDALTFEAALPQTSWANDLRAGIAGKAAIYGASPGFSVPDIPGAEVEIPEPGNPGVFIRELRQVLLFEVSVVSRAAYSGTDVDLRAWYERPDTESSVHWRRRLMWALAEAEGMPNRLGTDRSGSRRGDTRSGAESRAHCHRGRSWLAYALRLRPG